MKTILVGLFAVVILLSTGCDPGQIFGPNTSKVTVVITKQVSGDEFTPYINGEQRNPTLTDEVPTFQYRPRVQTDENSYYYYNNVEVGVIYVSVWSKNLARMSRVKSINFRDDGVYSFEFWESDF